MGFGKQAVGQVHELQPFKKMMSVAGFVWKLMNPCRFNGHPQALGFKRIHQLFYFLPDQNSVIHAALFFSNVFSYRYLAKGNEAVSKLIQQKAAAVDATACCGNEATVAAGKATASVNRAGWLYLRHWKMRHILPFLCLLTLLPGHRAGAQLYLKAKQLTMQEGLSDNRITCIFKDKTGFVWIGTKNGLNRYDGHELKIFKPEAGNSLSNEVINDLAEDSKGRLWVATMNGLNVYDPATGAWDCLMPLVDKDANDIPSSLIWDIHIDAADRVWIASDVQEFCFYEAAQKRFTYFDWPKFVRGNPAFSTTAYHSIKKFWWKNENEVLLASNKALIHLDTRTGTFQYLGGSYRSEVLDLKYDAAGAMLWASLEKGVLLGYNEKTKTLTQPQALPEPYPSKSFRLAVNREILMASENGLIRVDATTGTIYLAQHRPQLTGSLQPGGVLSVLQDRAGLQWVGTANGLSIYDPQTTPSLFLPLLPASDKEGSNRMTGVHYSKALQCYFVASASPAAVFVIDKNSGSVEKRIADENGRPFTGCNAFYSDRSGGVWLLTDTHVYRYHPQQKAFKVFALPNNGSPVLFRDMVQDAEGNYWFGAFHTGLYYYRANEQRFVPPPTKDLLTLPTVTALNADDRRNCVWIGTFSLGFYQYQLAQQKTTAFLETGETPQYAALNLVQDIAQDNSGAIWVATQSSGLFRFNEGQPYAKAFSQYSMKTGMADNSFLSLAAGTDSLLWALTGRGLITLNTEGRQRQNLYGSTTFNFSSFASDVRLPHAICFDEDAGQVLAAVGGGLLLHPFESRGKVLPPFPVVITSVEADSALLTPGSGANNKNFELAYHSNKISFHFAPLYFGAASDFTTEYKLEGEDEGWTNAGNRFVANYQNLAPGRYTFLVRVRKGNEEVAATSAPVSFTIVPPIWQRWWVITLAGLALAYTIYFLFRRRIRAVQRNAAIKQQLTELESKALRAQMNPHFIFNALNAIQECIVTEKTDAAFEYLSQFSRLLRMVLHHSEQAFIPLGHELEMLRLYLSLEALRFRQSFHYDIVIDPAIDEEETLVPTLLLQPFIENALWHGLRLKEGEKTLQLRFYPEGAALKIEISDNGIGRQAAGEIKRKKLGAGQFESKGTQLAQHRIDLLNRQQGVRTGVVVTDLKTADGTPAGTRVVISLEGSGTQLQNGNGDA
jgi:ligand-binding sensor domain-containing protein